MLPRMSLPLVLSMAVSTVAAQSHTTPIESLKGDPVQGGATSEFYDASNGISDSRGMEAQSHRAGNSSVQSGDTSGAGAPVAASAMPPPAPMRELAEQSQNGVKWLCGGIGQREVAYMKEQARNYDVMLTFAQRNGAYLADIDVDLLNESGRALLQTRCDGPIMLIDVPEQGAYRVRAETENHSISRSVSVRSGHGQYRHMMMTWPSSVSRNPADKGHSLRQSATTGGN